MNDLLFHADVMMTHEQYEKAQQNRWFKELFPHPPTVVGDKMHYHYDLSVCLPDQIRATNQKIALLHRCDGTVTFYQNKELVELLQETIRMISWSSEQNIPVSSSTTIKTKSIFKRVIESIFRWISLNKSTPSTKSPLNT